MWWLTLRGALVLIYDLKVGRKRKKKKKERKAFMWWLTLRGALVLIYHLGMCVFEEGWEEEKKKKEKKCV
jgi:hypothetical protein